MDFDHKSEQIKPTTEIKKTERPAHIKARTEKPAMYPERFNIPDDKVSWDEEYPEYQPEFFVAPVVLANDFESNPKGWADPEDIERAKAHRTLAISYEGEVAFDKRGYPLNPRGRTGIEGRGLLGKWGANFAADPIITRTNPETGAIEMLAIQRKDNGQWAIPGGMVDAGEDVSETLKREFHEEAGVELDMDDAVEIYTGYVDDPRNTDNSWMETAVRHKHLSPEIASKINPVAGDDAAAVQWLTLDKNAMSNLYASHGDFVKQTLLKFYESDDMPIDSKLQIEAIFKKS